MSETKENGARRQLTLILIVASLSLGGSYALFYLARGAEVWGTTNNGAFVDPPSTITELGWSTQDGATLSTSGQWWLWTVAAQCKEACTETLKNLRATHILLNREAKRVRRGITTLSDYTPPSDQPDLLGIRTTSPQPSPGVYIVDPLGNLVFFYALDTNPKLILKDLKKLLKVSQIG